MKRIGGALHVYGIAHQLDMRLVGSSGFLETATQPWEDKRVAEKGDRIMTFERQSRCVPVAIRVGLNSPFLDLRTFAQKQFATTFQPLIVVVLSSNSGCCDLNDEERIVFR